MSQVLHIAVDGKLSGLQVRGKGFDLRKMGRAEIERVSDIRWDADNQAWEIHLLRGTRRGLLTRGHITEVGLTTKCRWQGLQWSEYADAVACEVQYVTRCIEYGYGEFVGIN